MNEGYGRDPIGHRRSKRKFAVKLSGKKDRIQTYLWRAARHRRSNSLIEGKNLSGYLQRSKGRHLYFSVFYFYTEIKGVKDKKIKRRRLFT